MLKSLESVGFIKNIFLKEVCFGHKDSIYFIKKTDITILLNITLLCSDLVPKKYFLLLSMLKIIF